MQATCRRRRWRGRQRQVPSRLDLVLHAVQEGSHLARLRVGGQAGRQGFLCRRGQWRL